MIAVADYTSSLIEGAFLLKRVTFPEPRVERVVLPIQEKDSQKTVLHQGNKKDARMRFTLRAQFFLSFLSKLRQ